MSDINRDGVLDLVVANADSVAVLLGIGDGTFLPPLMNFGAGTSWGQSLALADLDGDGDLDVVAAGSDESIYNVAVLLSHGDGTFEPAISYPAVRYPASVTLADVNHDGRSDLIAFGHFSSRTRAIDVSVALGNGDGTFQAPAILHVRGIMGISVTAADLDRNCTPDLALVGINFLQVML
ncbi:MAG: FG-GAP repeat domain-containing protein, partial [Terriglobales bacterium]